jgi:hypothetical protein
MQQSRERTPASWQRGEVQRDAGEGGGKGREQDQGDERGERGAHLLWLSAFGIGSSIRLGICLVHV